MLITCNGLSPAYMVGQVSGRLYISKPVINRRKRVDGVMRNGWEEVDSKVFYHGSEYALHVLSPDQVDATLDQMINSADGQYVPLHTINSWFEYWKQWLSIW